MDFANQKARKVGVFTDSTLAKLLPMQMAIESLEANNVQYEIFDRTRIEPNQESCVPFSLARSPPRRSIQPARRGADNPQSGPVCIHSCSNATRLTLSTCEQLGGGDCVRQEARLLPLPRRRRRVCDWCVSPALAP